MREQREFEFTMTVDNEQNGIESVGIPVGPYWPIVQCEELDGVFTPDIVQAVATARMLRLPAFFVRKDGKPLQGADV